MDMSWAKLKRFFCDIWHRISTKHTFFATWYMWYLVTGLFYDLGILLAQARGIRFVFGMTARQWSCSSVNEGMAMVDSRCTGEANQQVDIEALIRVFCQHFSKTFPFKKYIDPNSKSIPEEKHGLPSMMYDSNA